MKKTLTWLIFSAFLITNGHIAAYAKKAAVPVTTFAFHELAQYPSRSAPATTLSINDTQLSTEITGTIVVIEPQVGSRVNKGDLLAKLDCQDHKLAADQYLATYNAAKADEILTLENLNRAKKLFEAKAGSREVLAQREAEHDKAAAITSGQLASLQTARHRASKCEIRAPFNAVVIERHASIGEYAMPGKLLFRLLDQEQMEVSANIQEQDVNLISQATHIAFVSGQKSYPLSLRTVLPLIDSRLRSYPVRLNFLHETAAPGEAGRVVWQASIPHLPAQLVVLRNNQLGVFVADQYRAKFIAIPDAISGHPAAISLPPTTQMIVDGRFILNDGDPITIRN